jgi:hypothetical protein
MIDAELNAYVLEINACPSMRTDYEEEVRTGVYDKIPSLLDHHIKF